MRSTRLARNCGLVALLFAAASALGQEVVYDNMSSIFRGGRYIVDDGETSSSVELPLPGGERTSQAGDLIVLASNARLVTDVQLRIRGITNFHGPIGMNVTLRLWEVDNGIPGDMLWSGIQPVTLPTGMNPFIDAFFSPGITVPDTLIWTFALDDIVAPPDAIAHLASGINNQPASVGDHPFPVIWQDSDTLVWNVGPSFGTNLEARFTAVPSPGASLLLPLGLLAMGRRNRPQP